MVNTDVELNELLGINSEDNTTNGASAENSAEDTTSVAASNATDEGKSKRENDRIRELVEENKKLKESQNWLDNIQDEGTRELLKKTIEEAESRIESKYKPLLNNYEVDRFEKEFAQYADKIPNLSLHKEELKKEFTRNPNADLKGLIGSHVMDIVSSKITPIETKVAQSPRGEPNIDLNAASKEDLYALLKTKKN